MKLLSKDIQFTLFVTITLIVGTLVGLLYVGQNDAGSTFWPAAGFYTAFYYLYRKKAIPGIVIGLVIANFGYRFAVADESLLQTSIITLFFVVGNIVEMYLFTIFNAKVKTNLNQINKLKHGIRFSIATLGAVAIGSVVSILVLVMYFGFSGLVETYLRWMIGNFTGVLVFGSLIFYSYYSDELFTESLKKNMMKSTIYILSYIMVLYFVFGDSGHNFITFENFQIAIVIMYIIAAFVFSYRMILINNLLFLVIVSVLYYSNLQDQVVYQTVLLSIYIMTFSSVSSLVRNVLIERQRNYFDLELARKNLEKIIVSTNDLFKVQNRLPGFVDEFSVKYLKDMFNLACNIYPKFNRASCYIKGEKSVQFIDAMGYDSAFLTSLQFNNERFYWELGKPQIIYNTSNDNDFYLDESSRLYHERYDPIRESIRFSVIIGEDVVGGMGFDILGDNEHSFDQYDLENFESFQTLMNSYYSIGILNTKNNNLKDDLVLSLVRTLELYDSYTGSHSEEVARLAVEISRGLGLNEEEIRHIYWASIVHDIGKIGISDEILNKPGKLEEMEYEIVKNHALFGYRILSTADGLKDIAKTVKHHHEWWNGKGYPDGLRSVEIPYAAQIIQVCDSVCAMSTDRVYHKRMSQQDIIQQLEAGMGKQFSPKVAKYMIEYIRKGHLDKIFSSQNKKG